MPEFSVLKKLQGQGPDDEDDMNEAEQEASKNYAVLSNARRRDNTLEGQLAKPLVLPSEPQLDIAHSSPGVRQLSPDELQELLKLYKGQ